MVNNSTNINQQRNLNSDGQQFHQYQQNKESLNSDGQQLWKYQQNKESLNSDGQQFHQYQQNKESLNSGMVNNSTNINFLCFVDIGGMVNRHCLNFQKKV